MYIFAVVSLGLNDEAFGQITLQGFWSFWEGKQANFRRLCYLVGIAASAVYNVRRTEKNQRMFSPDDFVPRTEKEADRENTIGVMMGMRGQAEAIGKVEELKEQFRVKLRLPEFGYSEEEIEEMLQEVFQSDAENYD